MKTKYIKVHWLIPLLELVLIAVGVVTAAHYLDLDRKMHSDQAFSATLDRLYQVQRLSAALKTLHDGDAGAAAQRLDLLLCDNILIVNSELASANDRERAYVRDAFARIAHLRPRDPDATGGNAQKRYNEQIEAEKILTQATVEITRAN